MAKGIKILSVLLAAALLLTGCGLRTLDQLYCLPKRSEAYHNLQEVIDSAMDGLAYSTPINGDHRQVVQVVDLDGDGVDEYLVFAKNNSEKPLKILIFSQLASGFVLMDTIEGYGFAFDFVEYMQLDDQPGVELIVGRQLTDQMVRSVSVYRFSSGFSRQLLTTGYTRMVTCDLDSDGIGELFLLNHGQTEDSKGSAVLYRYDDGNFQRSVQLTLSSPARDFRRLSLSALKGGRPAVYVTTAAGQNALVTDVFSVVDGQFCTVVESVKTNTLNNYFVFPEDLNGDGVVDLPEPVPMPQVNAVDTQQYLLRWTSIDRYGNHTLVLHTFHEMEENWYFRLQNSWIDTLSVVKSENSTTFYRAGQHGWEPLFVITLLTDADRLEQSQQDGRIVLRSTESVIYVAEVMPAGAKFGVTKDYLVSRFTPIRVEIDTEEE